MKFRRIETLNLRLHSSSYNYQDKVKKSLQVKILFWWVTFKKYEIKNSTKLTRIL